jgi:hypothetical protein
MSRSRAAVFAARAAALAGAAAVVLAVPLFGATVSGADPEPAAPPPTVATTDSDDWMR